MYIPNKGLKRVFLSKGLRKTRKKRKNENRRKRKEHNIDQHGNTPVYFNGLSVPLFSSSTTIFHFLLWCYYSNSSPQVSLIKIFSMSYSHNFQKCSLRSQEKDLFSLQSSSTLKCSIITTNLPFLFYFWKLFQKLNLNTKHNDESIRLIFFWIPHLITCLFFFPLMTKTLDIQCII